MFNSGHFFSYVTIRPPRRVISDGALGQRSSSEIQVGLKQIRGTCSAAPWNSHNIQPTLNATFRSPISLVVTVCTIYFNKKINCIFSHNILLYVSYDYQTKQQYFPKLY
jgi:hypothetical protein